MYPTRAVTVNITISTTPNASTPQPELLSAHSSVGKVRSPAAPILKPWAEASQNCRHIK